MKRKFAILALLFGSFALSFFSCSKVSNAILPSPTASKFLTGADGPPLLIVDNIESGLFDDNSRNKSKVNPNRIESVVILSPASTNDLVKRFGEQGKNGVILVTTKK